MDPAEDSGHRSKRSDSEASLPDEADRGDDATPTGEAIRIDDPGLRGEPRGPLTCMHGFPSLTGFCEHG